MSSDLLGSLLVGGHASSAIIVGHHAGLWSTFAAHPGRVWTLSEFADAADCKERWIKEWVGVLASAKLLSYSSEGKLTCPASVADRLVPGGEICYFSCLEFFMDKETELAACFKKDGPLGLGYARFPDFHNWMKACSMIKPDQYPKEFVSMVGEGLDEALQRGISVLEAGCGSGLRAMALGKYYPNSTYVAFDIDGELIEKVKQQAKDQGISNVTFCVADFTDMPEEWNAEYDYLMLFDVMHDLSFPTKAMAGIHRVLKQDALFTMEDVETNSDMSEQTKSSGSALLYNISLHHCMSVSLAQGGVGLGTCWGTQLAQRMLKEAGFDNVRLDTSGGGAFYVVTQGKGLKG